MRRTSALIVGGGPAGCASAIALSRAGVQPELLERAAADREVVCGSFLGWDTLASLDRLGVDVWSLGARRVNQVRLVNGKQIVVAALPQTAAVLSRRLLDETLLRTAESQGAKVRRGVVVRSASGRMVRTAAGEEIACEALFLATGKHDLRGMPRPEDRRISGQILGIRCALRGSPELARSLAEILELHLFDAGYAGLVLQKDGDVNLCLSLNRGRMPNVRSLANVLSTVATAVPSLRTFLERAQIDGWSAVAGTPYGWRATRTEAGVFRLGDQGAVIASLVGDGIALALGSGMQAAEAYLAGGPNAAIDFQKRLSRKVHLPLAIGTALRRASEHNWGRAAFLEITARAPALLGRTAMVTRAGDYLAA